MNILSNPVVKKFIIWRLYIFMAIGIAPFLFQLQENHLGGGMGNYITNPTFWALANFDGEHYISIATYGYKSLQHFFFPVYPYLVNFLSVSNSLLSVALTAQFISNVALLFALWGFWKLIRIDYSERIANLTLVLLLSFPTSFFLAGIYTESLFLALIVWSFYFARKKNWLLAVLFAGVSSGVRIIGVAMLPALLIEWYLQNRNLKNKNYTSLFLLPITLLGIGLYMFYLQQNTGDPLLFKIGLSSVYGEHRSDQLILLPQVLYRYFFKILPNMNWWYFHGSFTLLLEFLSSLIFLLLSFLSFIKIRKSYAFYLAAGFFIPTFSGSFSSMARYILVLFPGFILMAILVDKSNPVIKNVIVLTSVILMGIATAMFSRGYWVA